MQVLLVLGTACSPPDVPNGQRNVFQDAWALRAVQAAGNYAEIYERNLDVESRLGIPRGLNQLRSMGGVLYAPPSGDGNCAAIVDCRSMVWSPALLMACFF
jgi:hypothetical protein